MKNGHIWIENIEDFKKISGEWDRAVERSGSYDPFLLSDFILSWHRYFGKSNPLRFLVLYDNGQVSGGIPLCLKRGSGPYGFARMLCHAGGTAANYTEPLYPSKDFKFLPSLKEALSERKDWDLLYLSDLRQENRLLKELLSGDKDKRFTVKVFSDHSNWSIDLSGGLEKYLSGISPKLKRDLRAKRRHLEEKFGAIKLNEVKGSREVERLFDLYSKYSLDAFAERGRASSFEKREYSSFFREFLVLMEKRGRLDAHLLSAGEEPLAISFGYKFGPGFNWALTAFNSSHKYYRPGYLLIEELLRLAASRSEKRYNWYGYERFYKAQWCNRQEPLYRVLIVKRNIKGRLYRLISLLERALRSNKTMLSAARRLKRS